MHHQSQSLQNNLKQLGRKKLQSDLIMQKNNHNYCIKERRQGKNCKNVEFLAMTHLAKFLSG